MGAADCAQLRPSAVTVPQTRPLTCGNVGYQATCYAVCSVVVLSVVSSNHKDAYSMAWPTPYRGVLPQPRASLLDGGGIIKI
jgi:hypothetical protein